MPLRVAFDRRIKLEFHGARITSDGGLLAYRELDDTFGLTTIAALRLAEGRRGKNIRHRLLGLLRQAVHFRGDAAFAKPELYELLEVEEIGYAIRLPANAVLQERIGHLLARPVGRPPNKPQVFFASFSYQAQSWARPRRVVAKVEWHQGELYPRVGFIVTNLTRPAERVSKFYNGRGTAEQWIREGKYALRWTRLLLASATTPTVPAPRPGLQPRSLALPQEVEQWSLTTLREKLVKIGARTSATVATSSSSSPRSPCRGCCSPRSCAGSIGSGQGRS